MMEYHGRKTRACGEKAMCVIVLRLVRGRRGGLLEVLVVGVGVWHGRGPQSRPLRAGYVLAGCVGLVMIHQDRGLKCESVV